MTYPQTPPPPPRGTPEQGRSGMGKVLLVALLIGLVVAALSGTGAFLGARGVTGGDATTRCDGNLCFSSFEVDDVSGFLTSHGFTCQTGRECDLWTGSARYEVRLVGGDGQRSRRYEASVSYAPGVAMPEPGEEFLAWFAALPFGAGAAEVSVVQDWLAQNRQDGGDHATRTDVGGLEFSLVHREGVDMWVSLMVDAGEPWL